MGSNDPSPRDELRELARGLRRHVKALEEMGFAGGLDGAPMTHEAPAIESAAPVAEAGIAALAAQAVVSAPAAAVVAAALPFGAGDPGDDPTRRSFASYRGDGMKRTVTERKAALAAIDRKVAACTLCRLCEQRTNAVPGEGSATARVLFVGEGPGATEDAQGRPFVGRAGQLLTKIIESGMGLRREDVFIANIVKCRPPENRDPAPDEVAMCVPYLHKQIEILDPEVIIPLGRHSMRELAGTGERDTIGRIRGKVYRVNGRAVVPTYHPAYLLRSPNEKPKVWNDIQLAMKELGLPIPKRAAGGSGA